MDVDIPWRKKRPVEDDDYLESKRHLSERFFNMKISQPNAARADGTRSVSHGVVGLTAHGGHIGPDGLMVDACPATSMLSTGTLRGSTAPSHGVHTAASAGFESDDDDLDDLDDSPAPMLSRGSSDEGAGAGGMPIPHPMMRSARSTVDERVDDWVRTSRHRMLADASIDAAPDLCRALILYKPLPIPGVEGDEAGGGAEGAGGSPSPSSPARHADGDSGPAPVPQLSSAGGDQPAGSSTAEATSFGGSSGVRSTGFHAGQSLPNASQGVCTAPSGADDAGGAMIDASEAPGTTTGDAMEIAPAADRSPGPGGIWPPMQAPILTRVGTSRGAPTPELTPEWVAQARNGSYQRQYQDPGERGGGPSLTAITSEHWGSW